MWNATAYECELYFSIADEQHGAKWCEGCAFVNFGKYLPSLDYDSSTNVWYNLNYDTYFDAIHQTESINILQIYQESIKIWQDIEK